LAYSIFVLVFDGVENRPIDENTFAAAIGAAADLLVLLFQIAGAFLLSSILAVASLIRKERIFLTILSQIIAIPVLALALFLILRI